MLHAQTPATLQVVWEVSSSSGCELVSWGTLVLFFSRNKNKRCLFLSVDETEQEVDRIYSFFTRSYLILAMPLRWRFIKFRAYNGKISSLWTDDHITFTQIFVNLSCKWIFHPKVCTAYGGSADVVARVAQVPITVLIMTEIECVKVSSLRAIWWLHTRPHAATSFGQRFISLIKSCQQVMVSVSPSDLIWREKPAWSNFSLLSNLWVF